MLLKIGSTGREVREAQTALGIPADGKFGEMTKAAVINFQLKNNLKPDGIIGDRTWKKLLPLLNITTDISESGILDVDGKLKRLDSTITKEGLEIRRLYLDDDEYVKRYGKVTKKSVFAHHTAGQHNPETTINGWNRDNRGAVATQFCVGGMSLSGDTEWDGVVVECFPDGWHGWHLGSIGDFNHRIESVGIEINNWGGLKEKDGNWYAWPARYFDKESGQWRWKKNIKPYEVPKEQVYKLDAPFRGYKAFHNYTDKQIEHTRLLLLEIARRNPEIDLKSGLQAILNSGDDYVGALEFNNDAYYGRVHGLWSHTNVRTDKSDIYPHKGMMEMIKSL